MIKSSSEPALRAGSEGGGGYFKIFLGVGFREFSILGGGVLEYPPFSHPCAKHIVNGHKCYVNYELPSRLSNSRHSLTDSCYNNYNTRINIYQSTEMP